MNGTVALRAWIMPPRNRRFKPYMEYEFVVSSIGEISLLENTETIGLRLETFKIVGNKYEG